MTSHGFALNVANDLAPFGLIVPCGIRDRGVTRLSRLTGGDPDLGEVMDRLAGHLRDVFGRDGAAAPAEPQAVQVGG